MNPTNLYDEVYYPTKAIPQASPARLEVIGRLHGLNAAPAAHCRYLELGCGDAGHLIGLAYLYPESTFTGVDYAASAVARGHEMALKLGLKNLILCQADISDFPEQLEGQYHYISAHGVLSWVPAAVQTALFRVIKQNLAPDGIAYVSYNAYPGCRIREAIWGPLRQHLANVDDQDQRYEKALLYLKVLAEMTPDGTDSQVIKAEAERMVEHPKELLLCDDLSFDNTPFYFRDFLRAAEGLQFLSEADYPDNAFNRISHQSIEDLAHLGIVDRVAIEQASDAMRGKRFRQTLVCHDSRSVNDRPDADIAKTLHASSSVDFEELNLNAGEPMTFTTAQGGRIKTDQTSIKRSLAAMSTAYPSTISVAELASDDEGPVLDLILRGYGSGLIELWPHEVRLPSTVSQFPRLSKFAAHQLERGSNQITSLRFNSIEVPNRAATKMLALLDGSRSVAQVFEDVQILLKDLDADEASSLDSVEAVQEILATTLRFGLLEA
jgi:SAM-dependent methyltransferase